MHFVVKVLHCVFSRFFVFNNLPSDIQKLSHNIKQWPQVIFLIYSYCILWMSIFIVLRSRIWFCFMHVSDDCSTILMFYIFTLICHQRVAIVLVCYFYHDGGI